MSTHIASLIALVTLASAQSYSNVYTTDCGGESGCGTVNGCSWHNSAVAPTEGMFGVSCECPSGIEEVCTYRGEKIYKCKNGAYPNCNAPCSKEICLRNTSNRRNATGKIVSACPKYHPQNAEQCCKHQSDAYCTCIIRQTVDCATEVYDGIGGYNTFVDVSAGAC